MMTDLLDYTDELTGKRSINTIEFSKINQAALIPARQTEGSAGFDLHALEPISIWPGEWQKIKTGISAKVPTGCVGLIKPRSSLAARYGLDVLAGVIDSDYRGELIVVMINFGSERYDVQTGERVAQLVVTPIVTESIEVAWLDDTARGANGFGSTGA
jgi:dUTP pyrophosphatase